MIDILFPFIHAAVFDGWAQMQVRTESRSILFLLSLLAFAGMVKCFTMMKRPTTSTLCVLALAMYLGTYVLQVVGQHVLPDVIGHEHRGLIAEISVILAVLLFIVTIVVAIVGLALYDQNKYRQGRMQAVWAMVLSLLYLVSFAYGLTQELASGTRSFAQQMAELERITLVGNRYERIEGNFALIEPE